MSDLFTLWFRPGIFFSTRFSKINSQQARIIGFLGVVFGLSLGGFISYFLSNYIIKEFALRPDEYAAVIKNLNLESKGFLEMLGVQKAYALLIAFFSIVIAYMAPHILGGCIFAFLWLLARDSEKKLEFDALIDCSAVALGSMIYYAIPAIGPLIALCMVGINLSRALFIRMKLSGFMKTMSIIMALYFCFFVSAASLQLLAVPLASWL